MTRAINDITGQVIDAAIKVHRLLGPGLLESVYEKVLEHELTKRGFSVVTQQPMPVVWESVRLDIGFRADLIVAHKVVVEIKSVENVAPVHPKQLRTYLRLMDLKLGLLINFNVPLIKDGRVIGVLDLDSPHPNRFDEEDREGCERLVQIYLEASELPA